MILSVSSHQLFYLLHMSESYKNDYLFLCYSRGYCWKGRYSFIRSLKKLSRSLRPMSIFFVIIASYVRHMLYVLSLRNACSDSKLTCYVFSWGNAGLREHLNMLHATNTVLIHLSVYTTIF